MSQCGLFVVKHDPKATVFCGRQVFSGWFSEPDTSLEYQLMLIWVRNRTVCGYLGRIRSVRCEEQLSVDELNYLKSKTGESYTALIPGECMLVTRPQERTKVWESGVDFDGNFVLPDRRLTVSAWARHDDIDSIVLCGVTR